MEKKAIRLVGEGAGVLLETVGEGGLTRLRHSAKPVDPGKRGDGDGQWGPQRE